MQRTVAADTMIAPDFVQPTPFQHIPANVFPWMHPIDWLTSHFAVGGWSPLQRLSWMLTAHMTQIAPHSGFTWHPHRGLEIYTWVLEGTIYHEDTTGGKGNIGPGELQRMFSGDWIEHQELNHTDHPVRVIQIWFLADPHYRGLEPHYQQLGRDQLPARRVGDATVYSLIGGGSPMQHHVTGRLTAATLAPGGKMSLELPREDEELFVYVTDGTGNIAYPGSPAQLGQYDVMLVRPDAAEAVITAEAELNFLSFYLPPFLSR